MDFKPDWNLPGSQLPFILTCGFPGLIPVDPPCLFLLIFCLDSLEEEPGLPCVCYKMSLTLCVCSFGMAIPKGGQRTDTSRGVRNAAATGDSVRRDSGQVPTGQVPEIGSDREPGSDQSMDQVSHNTRNSARIRREAREASEASVASQIGSQRAVQVPKPNPTGRNKPRRPVNRPVVPPVDLLSQNSVFPGTVQVENPEVDLQIEANLNQAASSNNSTASVRTVRTGSNQRESVLDKLPT